MDVCTRVNIGIYSYIRANARVAIFRCAVTVVPQPRLLACESYADVTAGLNLATLLPPLLVLVLVLKLVLLLLQPQ